MLDKIKNYLRIDYDEDDELLNSMLETANLYLEGAITNWNIIKTKEEYASKVFILYCAIIQDFYDNRGVKTTEIRENRTIQSLVQQLDLLGSTVSGE